MVDEVVLTISETDVRETGRSVSGKGGSWVVSETDLRVLRGNVSENGVLGRFSETDVRDLRRSVSGDGGTPPGGVRDPPGGGPGAVLGGFWGV